MDAQILRMPLTHGWVELSAPSRLTERDVLKLRMMVDALALGTIDGTESTDPDRPKEEKTDG